jgi:hypothetical protein
MARNRIPDDRAETGKEDDKILGVAPSIGNDSASGRHEDLLKTPSCAAAPALDSNPPIALSRFSEESGLSPVTIWRYRRAGWIKSLNIAGRQYITRAEIRRFNERAASGEFAKTPRRPVPRRRWQNQL